MRRFASPLLACPCLRGLTWFSFPRLGWSLCAGGGFSYRRPLRFPLLDSLTFLLAGWWGCNALALAPRCPAGPRSLQRFLRLCLLSSPALNSLFSGLEALGLRTLFCPLWTLLSLGRDASLPYLLERLTR